jgi:hypothetical protein
MWISCCNLVTCGLDSIDLSSGRFDGLVVGGSQLAIFGFSESQGSSLTAAGNTLAGLVIATGSLEVFGSSFAGSGANVITSSNNGGTGFSCPLRHHRVAVWHDQVCESWQRRGLELRE